MKKIAAVMLIFIIFFGIAGCAKENTDDSATETGSEDKKTDLSNISLPDGNAPIYPAKTSFNDFDSWRINADENQFEQEFRDALVNFSEKSIAKLFSDNKENLSYSPVSLYLALSLASTGAESGTKDEMLALLGMKGKEDDYISEQNGKLMRLLYIDNEIGRLKIANSMWLSKDIEFKKKFVSNALKNFYSSLFNVDFADKNTGVQMEKWIAENTNGTLAPEIKTSSGQLLAIINTVYFYDEWEDVFDESLTKKDTFYTGGEEDVKCEFMGKMDVHGLYRRGDNFTAATRALKNRNTMTFILPDIGTSPEDLLSSPESVRELLYTGNMKSGKVIFKIPKFVNESALDLKDYLKSLGMKTAFDNKADFSAMSEVQAFISEIKQESRVTVSEYGVEAAAFTSIFYAAGMPNEDNAIEMILNRPFIYTITAFDGTLLFIGVVNTL